MEPSTPGPEFSAEAPPPVVPPLPPLTLPPSPLSAAEPAKLTIRRVDVGGAARIGAVVGGAIGLPLQLLRLLTLVPYLLGSGRNMGSLGSLAGSGPWGLLAMTVIYPIVYAVIGGLAAALGAAVYNWYAHTWGGLQVEVG